MRLITFTTIVCPLILLGTNLTVAQTYSDKCHVYLVDEKAAQKFFAETDLNALAKKPKKEQEVIAASAGVTTFDEFLTKVGEEELTTRTYTFPKSDQIITASVFYTDESMASAGHQSSVFLGIAVAEKPYDSAMAARNNAIAEISYDKNTDAVRVKKNVEINGRRYLVGLECRCKEVKPKEGDDK